MSVQREPQHAICALAPASGMKQSVPADTGPQVAGRHPGFNVDQYGDSYRLVPAGQLPPGPSQVPAKHSSSPGHCQAQAPQFDGSDDRSTQAPRQQTPAAVPPSIAQGSPLVSEVQAPGATQAPFEQT